MKPIYGEGDTVWVKSPSGGGVHQIDRSLAEKALTNRTLTLASQEDVNAVARERERQDLSRSVVAGVEGAVTGAVDAVVAPVKYGAAASNWASQKVVSATDSALTAATGQDLAGREAALKQAGIPEALLTLLPERQAQGGNAIAGTVGELGGRQVLRDLAEIGGAATGSEYVSPGRAYDKAAQLRASDNPLASGAGYVAGGVGAGIAVGGAASAVSGIRNLAIQGAIEAALGGAAQAEESAWVKDRAAAADDMIWSAALGGVLGFGGGALAGLFGKGLQAVGKTMYEAGEAGLARRAAGLAGDASALVDDAADLPVGSIASKPGVDAQKKAFANAARAMGYDDAELIAQVRFGGGGDDFGRLGRRVANLGAQGEEDVINHYAPKVTSGMSRLRETHAELLTGQAHVQHKFEALAPQVVGDMTLQMQRARESVSDVINSVAASKAVLQAEGDATASLVMGKLGARAEKRLVAGVEEFEKAMSTARNPGDVAVALDSFKRASGQYVAGINEYATHNADAGGKALRETLPILKGSYQRVRGVLEDETLWGQPWGSAQREMNEVVHRLLDDAPVVRQLMEESIGKVDDGTGWSVTAKGITANKVSSAIRKVAADTDMVNHGVAVPRYFQNLERLADIAEKHGVSSGGAGPIREVATAFGDAVKAIQTGRKVRQIQGEWGDSLLADVLGSVPVVGPFAKRAVDPARFFGNFESMGAKFGDDVRKAVSDAMADAYTKVADKARAGTSAPDFFRSGETVQQSFKRVVKRLESLADPEELSRRIGSGIGEVSERAPGVATEVASRASSAVHYLLANVPGVERVHLIDPDKRGRQASDRDIQRFARKYQAVSNPSSLIPLMKDGQLTKDHVEALRAVYPGMHQRMQEIAIDTIRENPKIPYDQRRRLDMLLDLQGLGEPTLAPEFRASMQAAAQAVAQTKSQPPRRRKPPDLAKLQKGAGQEIRDEK